MFNQQEILARVHAGQILPTWRVFQPRPSYFTKTLLTYVFLALICVAALLYMYNAHIVFVPGYGTDSLSPDDFHLWRIIDNTIDSLFLVGVIGGICYTLFDMSRAKKQFLVLTPEGFIVQKNREPQAIAYSGVASMKANVYRSNVGLAITPVGGGKAVKVGFDGRFGDARQITTGIMQTQRAYVAAAQPH